MHALGTARRVDQKAALRLGRGNCPETLTQALMKVTVESLETVGGARPLRGSREADLYRKIEDQGQIRRELAEHETVQRPEIIDRQATAITLVRERRIGEAVADHPHAPVERRPDQLFDMIAAGGIEQQNLGNSIPAFRGAFEQQLADRFRPGRAARLARALNRDAGPFQRRREKPGLRRFAGALAAFDRNEPAAFQPRIRSAAQRLLPQTQLAAAIATRPNMPIRSTPAAA